MAGRSHAFKITHIDCFINKPCGGRVMEKAFHPGLTSNFIDKP